MQVATIEKQLGTIRVLPAASGATESNEDSAVLMTGQQLVTGENSGLALRWLNGESIRLAERTKLRLTSAGEINMLVGRIYVDTDEADSAGSLHISTPAGRVRHIGTRYMTAVSANGTSVSVREGQVLLDKQGVETLANGGDQLKVDALGILVVQAVPTYGALWQWTEELAPIFQSDGRSMADFLDWVAHESGRAVEFASPAAEQLAGETLLRGQVDMEPMHALALILQTSDLTSEVYAGTIVVRLRAGG
jgi:ferric-dicitrate binding protein FerR (iron transport regulator)